MLDLHALANVPGAGKAAAALRAAGAWDEDRIPGPKRYVVRLRGQCVEHVVASVEVVADDKEAAQEKAWGLPEREINWNHECSMEVETTDAEAECVGRVEP